MIKLAMTIEERIEEIQKEIRETPYHKGTEHHIGRLKARLAQLKDELFGSVTRKAGGGGGGYAVRKSGDASIILVGPPSVGKSSLLNKLTDARSKVGEYDFTTLNVVPGMMFYNGAKIQIFDVPGIVEGAATGKGRGKEVLSVVRNCDLVLIMTDIKQINQIEKIKRELYEFGLRLDDHPPKVMIKKDIRGGTKVTTSFPLTLFSAETVQEMAREFKIKNGEIHIKENMTLDRLIDAFMGNRIYIPYINLVNKIDLADKRSKKGILPENTLAVSAEKGSGLEELKQQIWQKLGLIRIYLKPKDEKVDDTDPLIIKSGLNLTQILNQIQLPNKEMIDKVKVSGPGAKFPGQEVSFDFKPLDGTVISFLQ
jgi:uncharacterized protein